MSKVPAEIEDIQNYETFPSLLDFCLAFPLYPAFRTFHLLRDLMIKGHDNDEYLIIDGFKDFNFKDYLVLLCRNNAQTVYISCSSEDELNLNWLHKICCKAAIRNWNIILAIHGLDSIIYQHVHASIEDE